MNCRQARDAFEDLIDEDRSPADVTQLEEHLAHCPECQVWARREQQLTQTLEQMAPDAAPADFTRQVLASLPDVSFKTLEQVVRLLARAWAEPDFREKLRARPRPTLERLGIELPAQMRVEVVSPQKAVLPTSDRLALPLPAASEGSRGLENLRARLRDTPASVLVEPGWIDETTLYPEQPRAARRGDAVLDRLRRAWESFVAGLVSPAPRRVLVPVLAAAATLVLLFALIYGLQGEAPAITPGTASGAWSWLISGGVVVAAIVILIVVLGRGKK